MMVFTFMKDRPTQDPDELSDDSLFRGRVLLHQPLRGYRFSVDAPLLVWFACPEKPVASCADLGAGCGVLGISLLVARRANRVVAVELQSRLARLAQRNAAVNNVGDRYSMIEGDILAGPDIPADGQFELVVSNPPFWPADNGRPSPDLERQIARHETHVTLHAIADTARRLLHPTRGRFCIAYPARRLEHLLMSMSRAELNTTRILFVHPRADTPAELVLLECRRNRNGHLRVEPPLVLKDGRNRDTEQAEFILAGGFAPEFPASTRESQQRLE